MSIAETMAALGGEYVRIRSRVRLSIYLWSAFPGCICPTCQIRRKRVN